MLALIALLAFCVVGAAWLTAIAYEEHRSALRQRRRLLDGASMLLVDARIDTAADGFPRLTGRLSDRRHVTVELIPDTLVMRRLPQLWLVVTVRERFEVGRPSLGALARPTGAEFYAHTYELPERVDDPLASETGLLVRRGGRLSGAALEQGTAALRRIFRDQALKEIVATPRGVRVVRQASEGDRGAHLLLRQARFDVSEVAGSAIEQAIAAADALRSALDRADTEIARLSA